jgi:hypothetical protein
MESEIVIQGRLVSAASVYLIRRLMEEHPSWNRTRLSRELCNHWGWVTETGQKKDMACRSLLLKLERRDLIKLPKRQGQVHNDRRFKAVTACALDESEMAMPLRQLRPISICQVKTKTEQQIFVTLLTKYHYLGYSGSVGENIKYLAYDASKRPIAALLFGSAAWALAPRDQFIGWEEKARKTKPSLLTNNQRFLIAPWVKVPHLASHLLAHVAKRIVRDWILKYGHPLYFLETFVEVSRFKGTCYKAAGWQYVGKTQGRSRQDRHSKLKVPVKAIYLYPLVKNAARRLR